MQAPRHASDSRPPTSALANLPPQIAASSIVGATEEGDRAVRIWYMPALRGASDKPTRKLHKTPAIRLADERDAQTAVRHIRQACCWAGRPEPPRLLVIINPASGPGRCVRELVGWELGAPGQLSAGECGHWFSKVSEHALSPSDWTMCWTVGALHPSPKRGSAVGADGL